jgi:hypothetical protein
MSTRISCFMLIKRHKILIRKTKSLHSIRFRPFKVILRKMEQFIRKTTVHQSPNILQLAGQKRNKPRTSRPHLIKSIIARH